MKQQQGVTLVELVVTIGLVALIAGISLIALNPSQYFARGRNTQRWAHVNTVLNAVQQRTADNRGAWNSTCGAATVSLPSATTTIGSNPGYTDLSACLVPTYVPTIPLDPSVGVATSTGYVIFKDANNRITIAAPSAELGEYISVTR